MSNWNIVSNNEFLEPLVLPTSKSFSIVSYGLSLETIYIVLLLDGVLYEYGYDSDTNAIIFVRKIFTNVEGITVASFAISENEEYNLDIIYYATYDVDSGANRQILTITRTKGVVSENWSVPVLLYNAPYVVNCMASQKDGKRLYFGGSSTDYQPVYIEDSTYIGFTEGLYEAILLDGNKGRIVNMVCSEDGNNVAWARQSATPTHFQKNMLLNITTTSTVAYTTSVPNEPCNQQLAMSKNYNREGGDARGSLIYVQSKYNVWKYDNDVTRWNLQTSNGLNNQNFECIATDNTGLNTVLGASALVSTDTAQAQYFPFIGSSGDYLNSFVYAFPENDEYFTTAKALTCGISPNVNTNTNLPLVSVFLLNKSSSEGGVFLYSFNGGGSCFIKGTEITVLVNGEEENICVENLKKGDMVKISTGEYKKIDFIGYNEINIKKNMDYIRVMRKDSFKENVPNKDLFIVSGHSLLFEDLEYAGKNYTPEIYTNNIENYKKIMSSQCSLCDEASVEDILNKVNGNYIRYYHFSLENEDKQGQYAIYSNGMLSETMSINYQKISGLIPLNSKMLCKTEKIRYSENIVC